MRYSKRLLTHHRILAATASVAAIVLVVAASYALNPPERRQITTAVTGDHAAGSSLAGGCTGALLKSRLAAAVQGGASVIVATGTLTGKSVTEDPATAGAPAFYAMTLQPVQTLRGPAVAPGLTAWIPGPAPGMPTNQVNSALLAPGGRLFALVWPKGVTHDLVGPTLQLAPIVGTDVVFTPHVCWDLSGLLPDQYPAGTPLYTVPLATVRQIAASA